MYSCYSISSVIRALLHAIKYIGLYHNSSRDHHGMHLQLGPFYFKTIYLWSCFLGGINDWSSVLPRELL